MEMIRGIKKNRLYYHIYSYFDNLKASESLNGNIYKSEYRMIMSINSFGSLYLNNISVYKEIDMTRDDDTDDIIDTVLCDIFKPYSIHRLKK